MLQTEQVRRDVKLKSDVEIPVAMATRRTWSEIVWSTPALALLGSTFAARLLSSLAGFDVLALCREAPIRLAGAV